MSERRYEIKVVYDRRLQRVGLAELPDSKFYVTSQVIAAVYNATDGYVYFDNYYHKFDVADMDFYKVYKTVDNAIHDAFVNKIIAIPNAWEYEVDINDIADIMEKLRKMTEEAKKNKLVNEIRRKLREEAYKTMMNELVTVQAKNELTDFINSLVYDDLEKAQDALRVKFNELKIKDKDYQIEELKRQVQQLENEVTKLREALKEKERKELEREQEELEDEEDC